MIGDEDDSGEYSKEDKKAFGTTRIQRSSAAAIADKDPLVHELRLA